jgi:hypothetical protein
MSNTQTLIFFCSSLRHPAVRTTGRSREEVAEKKTCITFVQNRRCRYKMSCPSPPPASTHCCFCRVVSFQMAERAEQRTPVPVYNLWSVFTAQESNGLYVAYECGVFEPIEGGDVPL